MQFYSISRILRQYAAVTARVLWESGHEDDFDYLCTARRAGDMKYGWRPISSPKRFMIGKLEIPEKGRAPRAVLIHGGLFAVPPCGFG